MSKQFGWLQASATRNYSAAISSEDPATIRIDKSRAATSRCRYPKTQSDVIDGFPQADFLTADVLRLMISAIVSGSRRDLTISKLLVGGL